jgi:hypothetical protein
MFVCLDCGEIFSEPSYWEETHGLEYGPYESMSGCPYCGGAYSETFECDCCGEYITGEYYEIDDMRYCDNCVIHRDISDD